MVLHYKSNGIFDYIPRWAGGGVVLKKQYWNIWVYVLLWFVLRFHRLFYNPEYYFLLIIISGRLFSNKMDLKPAPIEYSFGWRFKFRSFTIYFAVFGTVRGTTGHNDDFVAITMYNIFTKIWFTQTKCFKHSWRCRINSVDL